MPRRIKGYVSVYVTVPNRRTALRLAKEAIGSRLAACCNILGKVKSVYRWKGKTCVSGEVLMILKTTAAQAAKLRKLLESSHPYECPCIVEIPFTEGSAPYLRWIDESAKT